MPPSAPPLWEIRLLGGIEITRAGSAPRRLRAGRATALMVLLARQPGVSVSRPWAIELLWPGVEPALGRNRLRQELFALRRLLEPEDVPAGSVLVATADSLHLDPVRVRTDLQRFETAVRMGDDAEARRLWRGPFAPGIDDDWASETQQQIDTLWDRLGGAPVAMATGKTTRLVMGTLFLLRGGLDDAEMAEAIPRPDRVEVLETLAENGWIQHKDGLWILPDALADTARDRCGPACRARLLARYLQYLPWNLPAEEPRHWRSVIHLVERALDAEPTNPALRTALTQCLTGRLPAMVDVGFPDEARRIGARARAFARRLPDPERIGVLTASAFPELGCGDSANAVLEEAEALARARGDETALLDNLLVRGIAAHHRERDATALRCFESVLALCRDPARTRYAQSALTEMGTALDAQGRYPESRRCFEKALALDGTPFARAGDARAVCHLRYADVLAGLGESRLAGQHVDQALRHFLSVGREHEAADCERLLARLALDEGREGMARLHARNARTTYTRLGNAAAVAAVDGILGEVARRAGRVDEAVEVWERGLAHWRKVGHARWQAEFWIGLARCRRDQGRTDDARVALDAALECLSRTRAPLLRKEERALRRELAADQTVSARQ